MAGGLDSYLQALSRSPAIKQALFDLLKPEAEALYKCLSETVALYYSMTKPIEYQRTWRFLDSVRIDTDISLENEGFTMRVYFDENASTHESIMGGKDGFVPILLNQGWSWQPDTISKYGSHYHFSFYPHGAVSGNYEATDAAMKHESPGVGQFVELAIERYFQTRGDKALPIIKVVTYEGQELERTQFKRK
jgi:hypothetical protein